MDFLNNLLNKNKWAYHMRGGYYTREVINGDDLDKAAEYVAALEARLEEAEVIISGIIHNLPISELELAREVWGNTNTNIVAKNIKAGEAFLMEAQA